MKQKTFFVINAVVCLLYGISETFLSVTSLSTYGLDANPSAIVAARYFGMALIGLGLVLWVVKDVTEKARDVSIAMMVSNLVGLGVALVGTLGGVMSAMGWSSVLIHAFFSIGHAYFAFFKK